MQGDEGKVSAEGGDPEVVLLVGSVEPLEGVIFVPEFCIQLSDPEGGEIVCLRVALRDRDSDGAAESARPSPGAEAFVQSVREAGEILVIHLLAGKLKFLNGRRVLTLAPVRPRQAIMGCAEGWIISDRLLADRNGLLELVVVVVDLALHGRNDG